MALSITSLEVKKKRALRGSAFIFGYNLERNEKHLGLFFDFGKTEKFALKKRKYKLNKPLQCSFFLYMFI